MLTKTAVGRTRSGEMQTRRPGRRRSPALEGLEVRSLLSVISAIDTSGRLRVTANAGDSITILSSSGVVKVDGADPDSGPFPSGGVTAIVVVCAANSGPDSNVIDLGGVTPSRFASLAGVSVDGGGGEDRLIGPDVPVTWGLTAPDAGILAGAALGAITSFTFASVENLVGGPGDDTFVFGEGGSLSGSIDGGGADDRLDFGGINEAVSVILAGSTSGGFGGAATGIGKGFRGIDALIGSLGDDTLTGEDAASTWNLDGNPTYSDGNAQLSFSDFGDLRGGGGADAFVLIGDSLGNLAENLHGGGGGDRFRFEGDVVLTGTIDGGGEGDTLDFRDYGIAVAVGLTGSDAVGYAGSEPTAFSGGGFRGIDSLLGHPAGDGTDTITGEDTTSLWSLSPTSSYDDGSARPLAFSGFGDIVGGAGDDTYRLDPPAGTALTLGDLGGDDTLDFSPATFGIAIDVDSSGSQAIGPGRALTLSRSFENIIGSPFPDAIAIAGSASPRFVEGGSPATYPGDALTFDAGGRSVTLSPTRIVALGLAPVTYSEIESLKFTNDSGLTVTSFPVTLALTSTPAASRYGQSLTFTLDVTASTDDPERPTGTVQFAIDGVPFGPAISLVDGVATSPAIATLHAGAHIVSAAYSGDANFTANATPPTTVNVARASLTITARDVVRAYGQANPAFAASYSGFVLGQGPGVLGGSLGFETSASTNSPAGSYAIVPGGLTSTNYAIDFIDGALTVTPSSALAGSTLTVTPSSAIPTYGQSLTLVAHVAAAIPSPETPAGTVRFAIDGVSFGSPIALDDGAATSPPIGTLSAGAHIVSATYSGDASHEPMTAPVTTLDVAKAPLAITANDAATVYGQANPPFTASYRGFVLGQDAGSLEGVLAFITLAASTAHVGHYAIIASGPTSDDYSINFVPGTLAVTPAPLTVSAVNVIKVYGLPVPMLTANYSGFVDGDGPSSLATPVTLATTAAASSTSGFYPITASGASSPDYTITYVNGLLAVPPSTTTSSPGQIAFVRSLYRNVLGRSPEPSGQQYWLERLAIGTTPSEVAGDIYDSPEHRRLQHRHGAPRIGERTALADALKAEKRAVRIDVAHPAGQMDLR